MKNLFKNSTIGLVILSFFVISCEKAKVPAPPPPKPEMDLVVWLETKGGREILLDDELKDGKREHGVYVIVPLLPEGTGNCNGKKEWNHHVVRVPAMDGASGIIDPETGTVRLPIHEKGVYTVTITYSCNGEIIFSKKVTISAK